MNGDQRLPVTDDSLAHREALDRIYAKVTWRILPFLFVGYTLAYLDRVNVGFAKLQMQQELGFSEAVYGFAAGIFFIGYVLFEIPSNLLLARTGARKTLGRILILWGTTSTCMMFVNDVTSFYILRFLLGVFEAGFAPGMLFYLTLWYASSRLAGVTAIVLFAGPVASLIGGPLSGWIMSAFHGASGWSGWQWMFLAEGLPAVLLGFLAFFILKDSPEEAPWLMESERRLLGCQLGAPSESKQHEFRGALKDGKLYGLALVCFCLISGIYTVSFWLPTLLEGAGVTSIVQIGLYSAIPYAVAAAMMIGIARRSDREGDREPYVAGLLFASALFLGITTLAVGELWIALPSVTLTTCCLWSALSVFWAIPAEFLRGTAAAGGIALINSIGLLGGFVSPSIIGLLKSITGSIQAGLWAIVLILLIGALFLIVSRPSRSEVAQIARPQARAKDVQ
jgi:sugar phosphate permease